MGKIFYEFLTEEQAAGRLQTYFKLGQMSGMKRKMEIYSYHLKNLKLSRWQMCMKFKCSKSYIGVVYKLMQQPVT